jgi:hypothetical protein
MVADAPGPNARTPEQTRASAMLRDHQLTMTDDRAP